MTTKIMLGWKDIIEQVRRLAGRQLARELYGERIVPTAVYGVPTGGSVVAALLALTTGRDLLDAPRPGCLIVDDLVDSGATARPFREAGYQFDALYRKPHSPLGVAASAAEKDGWIVFPWEHEGVPMDAARRLCQFLDGDPRSLDARALNLLASLGIR